MAEPDQKHRNVVIAMDGSEQAKFTFDWFVNNVHRHGDHVIIVHSVELNDALHSSQWYYAPGSFDETTLKNLLQMEYETIRGELEHYAEMMREHHVCGTVKSVHANKAGEGVVKEAEHCDAALICVGSRGKGKLRRTILGSTSDYIVKHAHVPVIVCRHKDHVDHHHHHFSLFGRSRKHSEGDRERKNSESERERKYSGSERERKNSGSGRKKRPSGTGSHTSDDGKGRKTSESESQHSDTGREKKVSESESQTTESGIEKRVSESETQTTESGKTRKDSESQTEIAEGLQNVKL